MLLEKTLLLKGVAGAAAVGGVVGGGYVLRKSLERAPTKEEKLEEINKKLTILGLGDCHFKKEEITNVNNFSKECDLDKTKFEKIKFSNMGANAVTVTGWGTSNIKLKIAENNSKVVYTFKEVKTKLTIKGAEGNPDIILKANVDRDFEDKNGKLTKVPASSSEAEKTGKVNAKLKALKIPDKCRFDETEKDENSIECDLSGKTDDLKKIDFSNKAKGADSKIEGSTNGLKLTINRLSGDEASKKHKGEIDLEFIFGGNYSNDIKIQDTRTTRPLSDIVLKPNTNPIFTITDDSGMGEKNRLSKGFNFYSLGREVGMSCTKSSTITCVPLAANKTIKLLNSDSNNIEEITVEESQKDTQIMTAEDEVKDYEQGVKFKVTKAFPTTNSKLTVNACYEAKYFTGKGWALSKKTTC